MNLKKWVGSDKFSQFMDDYNTNLDDVNGELERIANLLEAVGEWGVYEGITSGDLKAGWAVSTGGMHICKITENIAHIHGTLRFQTEAGASPEVIWDIPEKWQTSSKGNIYIPCHAYSGDIGHKNLMVRATGVLSLSAGDMTANSYIRFNGLYPI